MTDVIVVGAGIGGLAVAGGLLTDGHGVQVLEAAERLRVGGAAVTVFPNGHAALAGSASTRPASAGESRRWSSVTRVTGAFPGST